MMYRILSLVALGAFPALGECWVSLIVSLNPLVGYQDAVSEPALVGTWQATDGNDRLVVRATGPAEYELVDPKDDSKDDKSYQMRLILINGELLADVSSKNEGDLLLREHLIFRIRVAGDWLRLAWLGGEWLRNEITRPDGPGHTDDGCDVILTGSTAELQTLVGRYIYSSQAFDDDLREYDRVMNGEAKQE